jgi:uncharacterized membrane protein YjjP (DUF1212 family)
MAIESIPNSAKSISDAYVSVLEFDAKIAEDKLQYSSWLLAVATAGFAISVTQADKVLDGIVVSRSVGNYFLIVASVLFGVSAFIGALVKTNINKVVESHRQRMTLILRQQITIEADPSIIPSPDNNNVDDFVKGITNLRYLPKYKQDSWQEVSISGDRADSSYKRMLMIQQILVAAGFFAVLLASL